MKLRVGRKRVVTSLDDLSAVEQAQLVACAKLYDGRVATAAECLPDPDDEERGLFNLGLWDLEDEAGALAYSFWSYQVDSGTVFRAGTTDHVAMVIQFGLECDDDALAAAIEEIRK